MSYMPKAYPVLTINKQDTLSKKFNTQQLESLGTVFEDKENINMCLSLEALSSPEIVSLFSSKILKIWKEAFGLNVCEKCLKRIHKKIKYISLGHLTLRTLKQHKPLDNLPYVLERVDLVGDEIRAKYRRNYRDACK